MKRFLAFLIAVGMLSAVLALPVGAVAVQDEMIRRYVVLGDSISTGKGLSGYVVGTTAEGCFVDIFADEMGLSYENFALDGQTSKELLAALKEPTKKLSDALKSADVITLTIGGNDFLELIRNNMYEYAGIDLYDSEVMTALVKKYTDGALESKAFLGISEAVSKTAEQGDEIAKQFGENLSRIIEIIKGLNSSAVLIVQTVPNPYKGVEMISGAADSCVRKLNQQILDLFDIGLDTQLKVVDVYKVFEGTWETLMNGAVLENLFDPHPNAAGHKVIGDLVKRAYLNLESMPIVERVTMYKDVESSAWYYEALTVMVQRGVFTPSLEGGVFNPNSPLNDTDTFNLLGMSYGALGYGEDNTFGKNVTFGKTVTRGDIFLLVYGMIKASGMEEQLIIYESRSASDFIDVGELSDESKTAVEFLYRAHLINGMPGGMIKADKSITRAELAQILYNVYKMTDEDK